MSFSRFARRYGVRITLATALLALGIQPAAMAEDAAAGANRPTAAVSEPIAEPATSSEQQEATPSEPAPVEEVSEPEPAPGIAEPAAPAPEATPTDADAVDPSSTDTELEPAPAEEANVNDSGVAGASADEQAEEATAKLSPGCPPSDRSGTVTSVTLSETVVSATDVLEVNFTGFLPDGGCEGDFVRLSLPAELAGLTGSFPVRAPDGSMIGTMVVTGDAAVITFNNYLEDHVKVSFRGRLEAQVRVSVEPDTTYNLLWTAGDKAFVTPVTTVPCPACGPDDVRVRKFAEYHAGPPPYIRFVISSRVTQTANESLTFTDTVDAGQEIDCTAVSMLMGTSLDNWGRVQFTNPWTNFTVDSCTATSLRVSLSATAVGQYFRLSGRATPTAVQDAYSDSATVTQAGVLTGVQAVAELTDGDASGEGTRREPSVDIEKWSAEDGPVAGDYDDKHKILAGGADERIKFTIRNNGNEALDDIEVTDRTTAGTGTVRGLNCDFSDLGGPSSGTTWSGPFQIDESFTCTGRLPALGNDARHTDRAKVEAVGRVTGTPVKDTDDWNGKTRDRNLPAPDIDIEKWSTVDGPRAGDFDDSSKQLLVGVEEALTFKITNRGDEPLVDLRVRDQVLQGTAAVEGLTCDFSPLGGPSSGRQWTGPLEVGDSFTCRATLTGLGTNDSHVDRAIVTATGAKSDEPTRDSDDWGGSTRELPLAGGPGPGPLGPTGPLLPLVGASPSLAPISGLAVLLMVSGIWLIRRKTYPVG